MEKIYPYAVSKIKVKENKLLTKTALEQLANEQNLEKIVSVLSEKEYNFDIIERNEDFENVLKYEEEQLYKLIKNIIDENDFIEIFLSQNDYYNIKLILKSNPISQNIMRSAPIFTDPIKLCINKICRFNAVS